MNNKSKEMEGFVDDESIPQGLRIYIGDAFNACGINPKRINLFSDKKLNHYFQFGSAQHAYSSVIGGIVVEDIQPCMIRINVDAVLRKQVNFQKALALRMAECYNLLRSADVFYCFEDRLTNIPGTIIHSESLSDFKKLCITRLTILFSALKSEENASLMREACFYNYNPSFSVEDYCMLSDILRNWRIINVLGNSLSVKQ